MFGAEFRSVKKFGIFRAFLSLPFFGAEQVVLYGKAAVVIHLRIATVFVLPILEVIAYVPVLA